jgi:hypothetical protein
MAASTANRDNPARVYSGWSVLPYTLDDDVHIYRGTLVVVDSSNNGLVPEFASYDANYYFVGVALRETYNAVAADHWVRGDRVPVAQIGTERLEGSGFAAGDLGKPVYATDDHTVVLDCHDGQGAIDALYVGRIIDVISATEVEVEIDATQGYRAAICYVDNVYSPVE